MAATAPTALGDDDDEEEEEEKVDGRLSALELLSDPIEV